MRRYNRGQAVVGVHRSVGGLRIVGKTRWHRP